jgi:hypothetical protein
MCSAAGWEPAKRASDESSNSHVPTNGASSVRGGGDRGHGVHRLRRTGPGGDASIGGARWGGGGWDGRDGVTHYTGLTGSQKRELRAIAAATWTYVKATTDPTTALPMDNLTYAGGASSPTDYGRYTSATNIGVYLWSIVSARDLGLVRDSEARAMVRAP